MAINFPSTAGQPTDGSYTHLESGVGYKWDGESWNAIGANITSLTDLAAFSVTTNAAGNPALSYNANSGVFSYTPPNFSSFAADLGELANVDLSTAPTTGQVLKWDGSNWTAAADGGSGGGGIALTDLSVTTAAAGTAALSYNNVSGVFTYTPPDLSGYSTFSGSYNDLTDKPTIPTNTSDLNNDSGFITSAQTINNLNLPDASGGFTTGQGYVTFGGSTDFYLFYSSTDDRAKITSDNKLDIRGSEIYLWDGTNTHLQATPTSVTINHTGNSARFGTLDDGSILYGDVTVTGTIEIGQTNPVIVGRGNSQVVSNTAFGVSALNANTATGTENTALGAFTLTANTTGSRNTSVGTYALGSNLTGDSTTTLGYAAAYTNVAGSRLTAIGAYSQRYADSDANPTENKTNCSVGYNSLRGSATAADNTGNGNTAIGTYTLEANSIGNNNTALGIGCLAQNTEANYNIGVGYYALHKATTGGGNVAVGRQALFDLVDGDTNTAVGFRAAPKITSGAGNIAIGYDSLYENLSGNTNIAIGYECLQTATTVSNNVAIGTQSLKNVTCQHNVAVGPYALRDLVGTGETGVDDGFNTALGYAAGGTTANVEKNTHIGAYAGYFGWDPNANTQTANPNYKNVTCLGYNSNASGNFQVNLGENFCVTYAWGSVQNRSDERDKADIRDTLLGLNFIKSLRPVDFRWDYRDAYFDFDPETNERTAVTKDGSRKRNRYHHGLIAQEVKAVSDALGVDFAGYQDHKVNGGGDVLSIGYTELIAPMIKAMQELAAENAQLKARLDAAGL